LCGPAKNVRRLPQTVGIALTSSGIVSQRSGLLKSVR
jgi:hypothetical protein